MKISKKRGTPPTEQTKQIVFELKRLRRLRKRGIILTDSDIARKYGVSRQRIYAIEKTHLGIDKVE